MVNTPEEAAQVVSLCKYPPQGTRSLGGLFAPYGFGTTSRPKYAAEVNHEILVVVQIESAAGLANVEDICSVPGIDVAFVGPNDLHAQLGLTPSSEGAEPEFVAALDKIKAAAHRHNVALGMFCSDGEAAAMRASQGFHMLAVTSDVASLTFGANHNIKTSSE
jgi:4-hydroxy-2-oxoheptanedioate aldolase